MTARHAATRLSTFTLAVLIVYAPIETWYSMPALWNPFYLVDLSGIALLTAGVARVRRPPVPPRFAVLAAGHAWTASNMWRAFFDRVSETASGGSLEYGWAELCFSGCVMLAALIGLGWSLALATAAPSALSVDGAPSGG